MIECPGCGGPLAGDEAVCPACGASIEGGAPADGPAPAESGAPIVPSAEPEVDGEVTGKACPRCDAINTEDARYCVRCRHSFDGETTIFGINYLVIPAVILIVLIVAAAAAFSTGLVGAGSPEKAPSKTAAQSGAGSAAEKAINQTRNVSLQQNATAPNATATLNATPKRTVDPNSTPWNAAIGAGINHTEGGTHWVGLSDELQLKVREARATPTPVLTGYGDGSGHATGPLSWVGTGNWSPGFIDLPAGDAQVVLLSQGTTAFVLADAAGNRAGFGAFPPPGGQYTVPLETAGKYVIGFGTANRTDSWSATILLPGSGGQAVAPPVATPNTQFFTFAGTSGGSPGSFNLTPGTVHVQLYADQMTMAYLKGPWGETISTTVAGPNPGGSTVAITQTGTYRLDIWGPGAWSATVTWVGNAATGGPTVPTLDPAAIKPTLTPWNWTANSTANGTAANVTAAPTV